MYKWVDFPPLIAVFSGKKKKIKKMGSYFKCYKVYLYFWSHFGGLADFFCPENLNCVKLEFCEVFSEKWLQTYKCFMY